jgi:aerobic carbon-monoxide dehydrogenase medium subunit
LKAPSFAYAKPQSLAEALKLLENPGAKILAGGQSLIPTLNMRLSSPELLVDITGLSLSGICAAGDGLRIGALTTHAQVQRSEEVREVLPLLAEAATHIAHPAIRNRGTLGGSLALADPAAELPACALALDATFVIHGRNGERRVKAGQFFKGLFETEIGAGEILVAVEFPRAERSAFFELARRHGDYAIVGVAAVQRGNERRFAFFGAGATPVLVARNAKSLDEAKASLHKELDPPADLYNTSATKLHLAKVLLERAWNKLTTSH